ncbi:unnamed protein product [Caenorhabditis sp. 36 PRJEB53466]|nr:unnamed protein product [Caenorhabditis sp. 36 PRJEB53466]
MAAFPLFSLSRIPLKCVFNQLDHTTILEIAKGSKTAKRCVRRLEMPVKLCCVFMDINTRMSVATAGQEARVYYENPDCSWSPNEVRWTYQQMEELARRLVECFEVECHVTIDSLLDCVKSIKDLFVWKHGIDCPYIEVHDALMTDAEFEFLFDYSAATHDIRPIGRHLGRIVWTVCAMRTGVRFKDVQQKGTGRVATVLWASAAFSFTVWPQDLCTLSTS